ncbi:hypothetical protein TNCV_2800941 [Trichonephila clavipes]|nr:hypothetical protein TNCV_2800941 [Trichonephila clavipes]
MGYNPRKATKLTHWCEVFSIRWYMSSTGSTNHFSSKAVENIYGVLGGVLRAATAKHVALERPIHAAELRSRDRDGHCMR